MVSTNHLSSVSLYPLLPQRAASLNCHTPPLPLSQSNASITQLSYVTHSTPFSVKGKYQSTVMCPRLPPSLSKVSITQLLNAPLHAPSQSKINTTQLSYVPPLPPSLSKVSITQLSYAPL